MSYKLLNGRVVENAHDEKLTKRFGSTYMMFKDQYPDLYKLPEDEVKAIYKTFHQRSRGDTFEKSRLRTQNYIEQQMPRWQKDYFNVAPEQPKRISPFITAGGKTLKPAQTDLSSWTPIPQQTSAQSQQGSMMQTPTPWANMPNQNPLMNLLPEQKGAIRQNLNTYDNQGHHLTKDQWGG